LSRHWPPWWRYGAATGQCDSHAATRGTKGKERMKDAPKPKLCRDCRHCNKPKDSRAHEWTCDKCKTYKSLLPVDGTTRPWFCYIARDEYGECGPVGTLWEGVAS